MTMFLSLSGTLTSSVNSLVSLIPSAISLTISAGRLMDIVEMPQEDYSQNSAVRSFEKQHKSEASHYPVLWPALWCITFICFIRNTYTVRNTTFRQTLHSFKKINQKTKLIHIFENSDF